MAAGLVHFLGCFVELLGAFGEIFTLLYQFIEVALSLQQLFDAIVKYNLGFLDFAQGFCQLIGIFWVLIPLELDGDGLYILFLVVLQGLPLVAHLLEKEVEYFVQEGKDHPLWIALVYEGIRRYWLVRHLNVADLVVVDHCVPRVPSNAGEGFSHYELE